MAIQIIGIFALTDKRGDIILKGFIFFFIEKSYFESYTNDSCFNLVRSMKTFSLDNKNNFTCGKGPPAIGRNNIHG